MPKSTTRALPAHEALGAVLQVRGGVLQVTNTERLTPQGARL